MIAFGRKQVSGGEQEQEQEEKQKRKQARGAKQGAERETEGIVVSRRCSVVMYWVAECRSEATVTRRTRRNGEMSLAHLSACG